MPIRLDEREIQRLLKERKPFPADFTGRLKPKRGHKEREFEVTGADGSEFVVVLRQNDVNALDFSVILGYRFPNSNVVFRLRRYNGKHEHTNQLEKVTFYDFHVHAATERYQQAGFREDTYAQATDRYGEFHGAVRCMLEDCSFEAPPTAGTPLFPGE